MKLYLDSIETKPVETSAPKFITAREDMPNSRPNDFVRLFTKKKLSSKEIETYRKLVPKAEFIHSEEEAGVDKARLDDSLLDPAKMLTTWVKANNHGLDEEALVSYGRALLGESHE